MEGTPRIMALAHAVFGADCIEGAERAFYAVALEDLDSAMHLAVVLARAIPRSGSLWLAILDRAKEQGALSIRDEAHRPPRPFRWGLRDAGHTADDLADHMGWRDMERGHV